MKANQELPRSRQVIEKIPFVGPRLRNSREQEQAYREQVSKNLERSTQERAERRERLRNDQQAVEKKVQGAVESQVLPLTQEATSLPTATEEDSIGAPELTPDQRQEIRAKITEYEKEVQDLIFQTAESGATGSSKSLDAMVIKNKREAISQLRDQLNPPRSSEYQKPGLRRAMEYPPLKTESPSTPDKPTGNS